MQPCNKHYQSGAALLVSLMMLVVLAILGISGLANTSLEERMAQNFQHSTIAFEAAESAIGKVIFAGDAGNGNSSDYPFYSQASDPLYAAVSAGVGDTSTVRTYDMDPDNHLGAASLSASATVVYTAQGNCKGMSMGPEGNHCDYFDITSTATIDSTNAKQVHVQSVARPVP
jgi:hypothetical protein